jgi:hypothetical protein
MLHFDVKVFESHFVENLIDWSKGGPKPEGYTRSGSEIYVPEFNGFKKMIHLDLPPEQCLSKNKNEVNSWHISFLKNHSNVLETNYYKEYLLPRYKEQSYKRAVGFMDLFRSIQENGFLRKHPVLVADVSSFNLGFDYFRFDGCHRTSCAYVLGFKKIPAILFTLTECQ